MNKILALFLLFPLAAGAAGWRYDGQMASAEATPESGAGSSSMMSMPATSPDTPASAPTNNMTMAKVRERFGEPEKIVDAVGDPPIARWQYPEYVVYFEFDRVITAVGGHM